MAIPSHISSGPWSPSARASAATAAEDQREAMKSIVANEAAACAKRIVERMAEIEAETDLADYRKREWAAHLSDAEIIAVILDETLTDFFRWPDPDAAWNDAGAE